MSKTTDYQEHLKDLKLDKFDALTAQLPDYARPYLSAMRSSYQPNTLIAYAQDLLTFFDYLRDCNPEASSGAIKDIPIEVLAKLTDQDIVEYRNYLFHSKDKHSNNAASIARKLTPLRGLYRSINKLGYIDNDPTADNDGLRYSKKKHEIVYLEPEEVRKFINITENSKLASNRQHMFAQKTHLRDTAIIMLLVGTGIRVSECVGIDVDQLNFDNNSVPVIRKGGDSQTVYFSDRVATALLDYINNERSRYLPDDDEKALFLSLHKKRMTARSIEYMVKKYAKEAVPGKKITPHKMRSTYGTALYDETGDIRLVADVLGHSSVETTAKHYAAQKEKHRQEAGRMDLY